MVKAVDDTTKDVVLATEDGRVALLGWSVFSSVIAEFVVLLVPPCFIIIHYCAPAVNEFLHKSVGCFVVGMSRSKRREVYICFWTFHTKVKVVDVGLIVGQDFAIIFATKLYQNEFAKERLLKAQECLK